MDTELMTLTEISEYEHHCQVCFRHFGENFGNGIKYILTISHNWLKIIIIHKFSEFYITVKATVGHFTVLQTRLKHVSASP